MNIPILKTPISSVSASDVRISTQAVEHASIAFCYWYMLSAGATLHSSTLPTLSGKKNPEYCQL